MNRTDLFIHVAEKYNTDKQGHGYMPYYAQHLPERIDCMLEIGIAKGASAQMWQELYPDTDLHYLDLFLDPKHVNVKWCRERFIVPHKGSQSDISVLSRISEQFNVIIDDGSHNAHDQWVSFKHLFVNNLAPDGIYCLEDTHCNKDSFYWSHDVTEFEHTPLGLFTGYANDTPVYPTAYFTEGEANVFCNLIASISIVADEKLIIIKKK